MTRPQENHTNSPVEEGLKKTILMVPSIVVISVNYQADHPLNSKHDL